MLDTTETTVPILRLRDAGGDEVSVLDGRTRMLARPDEVGDAYAVLEQFIPPGKRPPLHVHAHETEIFYIVQGRFQLSVGWERVQAGPDACLVGPRGIPHTFRNVGEDTGILHLTVLPGRFGHCCLRVDAIHDQDRAAIEALLAEYDVSVVDPAWTTGSEGRAGNDGMNAATPDAAAPDGRRREPHL